MRIAEVSKKMELSADTLRYYEKIGLIDPVKKNDSGIRDYQDGDLQRIHFIKCMRKSGLSIEAIKRYIDLNSAGDETISKRRDILLEQKVVLDEKMADLQSTLDYLENKIDIYTDKLIQKEKIS